MKESLLNQLDEELLNKLSDALDDAIDEMKSKTEDQQTRLSDEDYFTMLVLNARVMKAIINKNKK